MKHTRSTRTRSLRRAVLASLALATLAAPAVSSGCTASFAPISQVKGLRVLGVVADNDKPYAQPDDTVTLTMTYDDTYDRPPPLIVWLGGCYDPAGDDYYGCYTQLATTLSGVDFNDPASLASLPPGTVGIGNKFSFKLPSDIITRRPPPPAGTPYYGLAYVFFAVCAGTLGPVPPDGTGLAGSFPIGCFDGNGNRLGADSFVPGYTSVYAFADGRSNRNPMYHGTGLTLDGAELSDGTPTCVKACSVSEDSRLENPGCGHKDPFSVCPSYDLAVEVCSDVAQLDQASLGPDGKPLHEIVWVDYFADQGDIHDAVLLVNDATSGLQPTANFTTQWIAPPYAPDAGTTNVNVYAVLHDSRGGETVIQKVLNVQADCPDSVPDAGAPDAGMPAMCPGG